MEAMFNKKDLCQVCRHYDIGVNQCSKAPKRTIPKSRCADYEYHPHEDLCKYCSHNNYGRCHVLGHKCSVEPFLANMCADFENKEVIYENKEYKLDCEMGYSDELEEEAERIANAKRIEEIRKRCEEFLQTLAYDFGDIIVADTVDISETERNEVKWNIKEKTTYVDKQPFIDFRLCFTAYKKD